MSDLTKSASGTPGVGSQGALQTQLQLQKQMQARATQFAALSACGSTSPSS